jgi:hypothetical protein
MRERDGLSAGGRWIRTFGSAVDGAKGAPSIFDSSDRDAGVSAPITSMTLASTEVLEGGAVWLRYRLQNR